MAVTKSFTLAEEELSCPICFEEFIFNDRSRHPKLLMCLHTFCTACIETVRKHDGTLQCSICRTVHNVFRTGDLLDNYLICDYLRLKQESEDERLANQLREEYNESLKKIQEQEHRDAQLAIEEERKVRLQEEMNEQEAERQEQIKRRLIREDLLQVERMREEEAATAALAAERSRRLKSNIVQNNLIKESKRMQQRLDQILSNEDNGKEDSETEFSDAEDRGINNDNAEMLSITDVTSEASLIDEEEVSDGSFQDFDEEESDEVETEVPSSNIKNTSLLDVEEAFSSHSDCESVAEVITISTSEEEEEEEEDSDVCDLSEPDLLSEEFSGVSQLSETKSNSLSSTLPSFCSERDDGSIVVLDEKIGSEAAAIFPRAPVRTRKNVFAASTPISSRLRNNGGENHCIEEVKYSSTDSGEEYECVDIESCSSTDDSLNPRKFNVQDKKHRFVGSTRSTDEENCKIQ